MKLKTLTKNLFRLASATLIGGLLASNFTSYFLILNPKVAFAAPSYQINLGVDKAAAGRGEKVTFELIVTNNGDIDLSNVNPYLAKRPANTSYVNGSSVVTKNGANTSIADAWFSDPAGTNLGSLTPGQALTFKWSVTIDNNAPQAQSIESVLNIKTAELQNPQVYSISFTVAINASRNSLCDTMSLDKSTANVGDIVTYTIRVCNDGDIEQNNVTLYDRLPSALTYKAGTTRATVGSSTVTVNDNWIGSLNGGSGSGYNMGRLSSGQSVMVTFQATVNNSATDNLLIENFAQTNSDEHADLVRCATPLTVRIPVQPATNPNCSVTKKIRLPNGNEVTSVSAGDHVYAPGEEIVYRLFVSNSGNGDANNFSLSDFLPTYIFWTSGDGGYASNDNKVNFDLGTLKASESKTLTYKAKVRDNIPSGQVSQTNNAKVTSPSNLTCTSSSNLTIGKPGAILAATALPQTGAVPTSVLATLGLVVTGLVARLRKIKKYKYWPN